MITNATQLRLSEKQLNRFREMLEAMRKKNAQRNPALFVTISEGYLEKIRTLEDDIISYLREHPVESPLKIQVKGPAIRFGIIKATFASQLIAGFQSAVYSIGASALGRNVAAEDEIANLKGLRSKLALDLVATAPGSFILAMDLRAEARPLFPRLDPAGITIEKLIIHVNEISRAPEEFTGDREALIGLRKVSELVRPGIETIDVDFQLGEIDARGSFNPVVKDRIAFLLGAPKEGEKTVLGQLIEIDIENNTCIVHPEGEPRVNCAYEENLEDDLITAIKKKIEMAGQFVQIDWPRGHYRITKIERFRLVEDQESED